jgi:hypothetical protein
MADKWSSGIRAGSTSVSTTVVLRSSSDGTEVTGKVAADLTISYRRQGGTRTAISLSNLAAIDSVWSAGGVKEDADGAYRLDLPDAAVGTGADYVHLTAKCTGSYVFHERISLATDATVAAIKAKTDLLVSTNTGKIDAAIVAAGDLAQAAADKVWASSTKAVTSVPAVALATSVWDETAASHNTAGSMGNLLNAAGVASDPLLNPVPGGYSSGTAGYVIGNIASESTNIGAIKAKTDQLTFTTANVVDASATGGLSAATIASAVLNTAMTEGYAADGAQMTLTQGIYMLHQFLTERSVSGVTMTIKKLDGSTTAAVVTMNSATNPTSYTRTA